MLKTATIPRIRPAAWLLGVIGLSSCERPTITFEPPQFEVLSDDCELCGGAAVHLTTDHFELYTTSTDPQLKEYLPKFLETTYQYYSSLLPPARLGDAPPPKLETYVLDSRTQWDVFVRERFPRRYALYRKITAGGFSEGSVCVVYDIGRAATLSVLAHEGLHQYLSSRFPDPIPAWINEGLATYCEAVEFRDDKPHFTPQYNTFRVNHLRDALAGDALMPLRELLRTDAGQVIDENRLAATSGYYAQAWALVVFLRHGHDGRYRERFDRLLAAITHGTLRVQASAERVAGPSPSEDSYGEAAFRAYISKDIAEFETEYFTFIRQMSWPSKWWTIK